MEGDEAMGAETITAFAGVDTHKDTNMLALLDPLCRVIGTWEFPTGEAGYSELERAIGDSSVPVGVEGTGSYGAGLTAYLKECGYDVYEVIRPKRAQRRRGKSDPIDAIAAAKNLAAEEGFSPKEFEGAVDDVRWLMAVREQLVRHMTAMANSVKAMLVKAPDPVRQAYEGLGADAMMARLASSRPKDACRRSMKILAKRWIEAKKGADELEGEIKSLVKDAFPALLGADGVDAITAARLIMAAGSNPERMKSEAAFSMLCGTSPIPASSGKTNGRHRLNRGGDRQANRAIHEIVRARMTFDERTRAYIAKKMSEGMTKKEAIRCLCRFVAREMFRLMTGPQEPLPDGSELASRRKSLGLTQAMVADALGMAPDKLSRLERGRTVSEAGLREIDELLRSYALKKTEIGY